MKIDLREKNDVVIAALRGRLASGVGDEILRGLIDKLLADGHRRILLDLSEVPGIDSSGIGELVASLGVAREFDAQIKILRVSEGVHRVLSMSQLLPVFDIYREEAEAIASFDEA